MSSVFDMFFVINSISYVEFKLKLRQVNAVAYKTMADTAQWLTEDMRRRIGWRIKEIRELHLEVDQKAFAERIGSNQSTVSRIERGKILPSVETVLRISEISGRATDWILKGVT